MALVPQFEMILNHVGNCYFGCKVKYYHLSPHKWLCLSGLFHVTGLWKRSDGGSGLVQEVHALWERKRSDSGLGPLLPRVQTHLQTAAAGQ